MMSVLMFFCGMIAGACLLTLIIALIRGFGEWSDTWGK